MVDVNRLGTGPAATATPQAPATAPSPPPSDPPPAPAPADPVPAARPQTPTAGPAAPFPVTGATPWTQGQTAGNPAVAQFRRELLSHAGNAGAFDRLSPARQESLAALYQASRPEARPSLLVHPPQEMEAIADLYASLAPAQQRSFAALGSHQQRALAAIHQGQDVTGRVAMQQWSAADMEGVAAMLGDRQAGEASPLAGMTPAQMASAGAAYGRLPPGERGALLRLPPEQMVQIGDHGRALPAEDRQAFSQRPLAEQTAVAALAQRSPACRHRPVAEQVQMAQAFQSLSPGAQDAFLRLSADQQASYGRVWAEAGRIDSTPAGGVAGSEPVRLRAQLSGLLASGRLTETGREGMSALDHLDRLRSTPLTPPVGSNESTYRQQLFNRLVDELETPTLINQGMNNTCGVTCMQRDFCRTRPADYTGFIVGLASTEGRGALPDGTLVDRVPDSLQRGVRTVGGPPVADSREHTERLAQNALANHISPTHYSNVGSGLGRDEGNVVAGARIPGSLPSGVSRLRTAIQGRPTQPLVADNGSIAVGISSLGAPGRTRPELFNSLQRDVLSQRQAGGQPHVPACINWNTAGTGGTVGDTLHWVEVTRSEGGRVYYENPHHGPIFTQTLARNGMSPDSLPVDPANGRRYIEVTDNGPTRRIYEDNSESVDETWFRRSLDMVVVDPAAVPGR